MADANSCNGRNWDELTAALHKRRRRDGDQHHIVVARRRQGRLDSIPNVTATGDQALDLDPRQERVNAARQLVDLLQGALIPDVIRHRHKLTALERPVSGAWAGKEPLKAQERRAVVQHVLCALRYPVDAVVGLVPDLPDLALGGGVDADPLASSRRTLNSTFSISAFGKRFSNSLRLRYAANATQPTSDHLRTGSAQKSVCSTCSSHTRLPSSVS